MRPLSGWERFRRRFIWGSWSWRTLRYYSRSRTVVIGRLKVYVGEQ